MNMCIEFIVYLDRYSSTPYYVRNLPLISEYKVCTYILVDKYSSILVDSLGTYQVLL